MRKGGESGKGHAPTAKVKNKGSTLSLGMGNPNLGYANIILNTLK